MYVFQFQQLLSIFIFHRGRDLVYFHLNARQERDSLAAAAHCVKTE